MVKLKIKASQAEDGRMASSGARLQYLKISPAGYCKTRQNLAAAVQPGRIWNLASQLTLLTNRNTREERKMATVTQDRETASMIGSDKVEGTAVYAADEQRIGTIQRVMIDKISGKVAYAVTSFGGFLGIGEDYYPLPWPTLKYDTRLGGYRTGLTADRLRGAPKYNRTNDWDWNDRARDRQVYDYYKEPLWY
jgi:hypothetical protein